MRYVHLALAGLCQDCGEYCKTCDAINDCKVCQAGFVSIEGQCLNSKKFQLPKALES